MYARSHSAPCSYAGLTPFCCASLLPPPPRARALQEVNMTAFTPGRPDSSVFEVPDQSRINTCDDNVCTSYARNRQAGKNPIMAFEGWL
jgi:hypothetical protein